MNDTQLFLSFGIAITVLNFIMMYLSYREARIARFECDRAAKYVDLMTTQADKADNLLRETRIELSRLRDVLGKSKEGIH
jgi:hypothetical protein